MPDTVNAVLRARTDIRRAVALVAVLGALAGGYVVGTATHTPVLPLCASDDGTGAPCVWRADRQGDGRGVSFVAFPDGTWHTLP